MFDKLIDFVLQQINNIIPFAIIFQFQKGVKYTLGKYIKVLDPGIHWKTPYIDIILKDNVVDTTMLLPSQSITTQDAKEVIVRATVGFYVKDIAAFFNSVYDTRSALADRTCVVIKRVIIDNTLQECREYSDAIDKLIAKEVQKNVKKYGIKINFIALTDMTNSRSLRLFNESVKLD